MKKINRLDEGVSPIIATILMVSITVVLSATLYTMVGNMSAEESRSPLLGSLNRHDERTVSISMTTPPRAEMEDVNVLVLGEYKESGEIIDLSFEDWDQGTSQDGDYTAAWYLLSNGEELSDSSRLRFIKNENYVLFDEFSELEIIIRVEDYSGTISKEL
ncbi:MAG: archaellin/type IV pilin N-terminal domain-containing protein [Candidatus Thermoplasmatota archaeon]